jgi:Putative DNA-binding domain
MIASDLSALIQAGESETVEFKQSTGETRKIVETVCAFANARRGTIRIGPAGGKLRRDLTREYRGVRQRVAKAVLGKYRVPSSRRLLFKSIFMVQPTKDRTGHHAEVWWNLLPVRLQSNG